MSLYILPQADTETAEKITQRIKERCICREDGTIDISIALGYTTKAEPKKIYGKFSKKPRAVCTAIRFCMLNVIEIELYPP